MKNRSSNWVAVAAVLVAALGLPFHAGAADVTVEIQAQPLKDALREFGTQTGVQVMYRSEEVATGGVMAPRVSGRLSAEEALTRLLSQSSLKYEFVNPTTVRIVSAAGSHTSQSQEEISSIRVAQADTSKQDRSAEPTDPRSESSRGTELEEIVVTGTHIRGVTASSSPLMVFDREDIARSGYSTVDQFMESLPQSLGAVGQDTINSPSIDAATNFGDGTSVNLRGLSGKSTLVLINGRRLAPGGFFGGFADVSLVPLSAVERIEILTDGASAIYGSDAVGGVVNFILRSDYEGAETAVEFGSVTDGDMATYRVSQSLGTKWNGGTALLAYEFYKHDGLEARDRDFASAFFPSTSLLGEQERHNVLASASHELSDRFKLFADALYSKRDTERNPQGPVTDGFLGSTATTKQAQVSLGARYRLSDTWTTQVIAGYSDYQLHATSYATDVSADADLRSLDAQVDGPLFDLPGGALRLAVGAAYRQENFSSIGEVAATSTVAPERTVKALFGELHVPFVSSSNRRAGIEALELSLAARFEDYSDFGSDITPKVGLRWEPVANFNLRASYGESFKAPDLNSVYSPELVTVTNWAGFVPGDPLVLQRDSGNPDLTSETAKTWAVGFDWRPESSPLSLSLTYYRLDFDGRITVPALNPFDIFVVPEQFGELLIANPGAALVDSLISSAAAFVNQAGPGLTPAPFDSADVVLAFDNRQHNLATENQRGFDVMLEYPFDAFWGHIDLSLNATYVTSFDRKATPLAPVREIRNIAGGPIDLRTRAGLSWSRAALGASLFVNYQDDYRNIDADGTPISSLTTFDLTLRYAPAPADRGGFANGLGVSLAVTNLLDKDPPRALLFGIVPYYDPANGDPTGRFMSLLVIKKW